VSIISRQLPDLAPMLKGVDNAFAPWTPAPKP